MYDCEAEGLRALRAAGVRAPAPQAHGLRGGEAFIEMERLALGGPPDWQAMARMIAVMHRRSSAAFGWPRDNYIGLSVQRNALLEDWPAFFRDYRLRPQLGRARASGHPVDAARLLDGIEAFFAGHRPAPSLLHGDLWSGNAGFLPDGTPVVYDPAVYYGDREADIAMTELFGGFGADFHAAYREAWPLDPGYAQRRDLYNLYHVLNHLNLFGGAYLRQAQAMIGRLEAELRY
jgi:fructosamine-3-kinase